MDIDAFCENLRACFGDFQQAIATNAGDWVVRGFIDVYKNIYTISVDTKVVSKIIELMLFPLISRFASEQGCRLILSEQQNHYPDVSLITPDGGKIALDLKSTDRINADWVNGFTLGSFMGYFRQRKSTKNITFPYAEYVAHLVLGIIYTRNEDAIDERKIYTSEVPYHNLREYWQWRQRV